MKTKEKIVEKLRDSFMALQKEYRVSERWVEHFQELFYELAQLLTTPAPPQSGVVDIYEERAHHSHTATSLDTAPPQSAEEFFKQKYGHTYNTKFDTMELIKFAEQFAQQTDDGCDHLYQLDVNQNPRCVLCGNYLEPPKSNQ